MQFMKASICLLKTDLKLNNGKEGGESMFSYIVKDTDWRNNGIQINLWLRNLKSCFFLFVKQAENSELFRMLGTIKKDHDPYQAIPHISTKLLGF